MDKKIKLSDLSDSDLELRLSTTTSTLVFSVLLGEVCKRNPNDAKLGEYIRSIFNRKKE